MTSGRAYVESYGHPMVCIGASRVWIRQTHHPSLVGTTTLVSLDRMGAKPFPYTALGNKGPLN